MTPLQRAHDIADDHGVCLEEVEGEPHKWQTDRYLTVDAAFSILSACAAKHLSCHVHCRDVAPGVDGAAVTVDLSAYADEAKAENDYNTGELM